MTLHGYNTGGGGPASVITVVTEDGKPSAPTRVRVTPYGKYIRVHWDVPEYPNGIITGYRVYISGTYNKHVDVDADEKSLLFVDLEPDTKHELTIQAETKQGLGRKASTVVTTKGVMGKLPLVKGDMKRNFLLQNHTVILWIINVNFTIYAFKM